MLTNFCDGRSKEQIYGMGIEDTGGFATLILDPIHTKRKELEKEELTVQMPGWHHKKGARIWRRRIRWKSELLGHQDESGVQDSLGKVSAVENMKVQLLKSFAQYSANIDSRVWKMDNKYIRGSKSTVCQNSSHAKHRGAPRAAEICPTMMVDLLAQINALKVRIKANRDKLEQLRPYLSIH